MLCPTVADERYASNALTDLIARYRLVFFLLLAGLYALTFNGQWRIGQDSAIYRGLADSIATGKGYVFGEWATHQAYPGLPYLLAAVQKISGADLEEARAGGAFAFVGRRADTVLAVIVIGLMSALTLVLTYRLMRLHYPAWIATCIAFGMGINSWYLQLSHELLTDIPFLLGVVAALYGWELLKRAQDRRQGAFAVAYIVPGLALAGSMRPMFWVVGTAWMIVCFWAILRGNRRLFHGIALLVLLAVWATLVRIDPRNAGTFNPFAGGYEREFLEVLPDAPRTFAGRLYEALRHSLPAAFFGEQMAPFSVLASLVVLASCALLFRRHALWAWMVFIAFAITLLASTEARYYIMVLPMMLLGWILMLLELMRRLSPRWATVVLVVGLGIVTANNLSADVGFIREQRGAPFVEGYKRGRYMTLLRTCDLVRTRVGDEERVLGPLASVMRYVTGKQVLSQREVLPRGSVLSYPQSLYAAKLNYAIFPSNVYRAKEPFIARLMERNILYPIRKVGWDSRPNGKWYLARVRVRVPDVPDWRELPKGWTPPQPPPPVKKTPKKQKKSPPTK